MHTYLNYLLAQKAVFFKLNSEVQRLAFESQQRLQLKRHELQDLLSALVQEAIREGSFRPVNPLLATPDDHGPADTRRLHHPPHRHGRTDDGGSL